MPDLSVSKNPKSLVDSKKLVSRSSDKSGHSSSVNKNQSKYSNSKDSRIPKRRNRRSRSSSSSSSDSSSSGSASTASSASSVSSKNIKKPIELADTDSKKRNDHSKSTEGNNKIQNKSTNADDSKSRQNKKTYPDSKEYEMRSSDNISKVVKESSTRNSTQANANELNEKTSNSLGSFKNQNRERLSHSTKAKKDDASDRPRESVPIESNRILVEKLTKNITKAHIVEIFSIWGQIHSTDLPPDRIHPEFNRGYGYIEYVHAKDATNAVNFMNGGQIDGQEVRVSLFGLPLSGRRSPDRKKSRHVSRRRFVRSRERSVHTSNARRAVGSPVDRNNNNNKEDSEKRRPNARYDKDRTRDRRDRPHGFPDAMNRPRRARRGSSGSPFANRPAVRGRSPGSRYRRPSPPNNIPPAKRARSRTPLSKPEVSNPKTEVDSKPSGGQTARRDRKATSRSSSSSSSSNSSTSSSGSSSSSSSGSSRS